MRVSRRAVVQLQMYTAEKDVITSKMICVQILYVTCVPSFCNVCINAFAWHRFTKTWRVQNIGDESWPLGCCLRFSGGDRLCAADRIPVEPVSPGCTIDLSVDMVSPEQPGIYESKWRMSTFSGSYFGGLFFLTLNDDCSVSTEGVRGNKVLTNENNVIVIS